MRPDHTSPVVVAQLNAHGPSTVADIQVRTGLGYSTIDVAIRRLIEAGRVERTATRGTAAVYALVNDWRPRAVPAVTQLRRPVAPPPSGPRALPVLAAGPGDRDETCRYYAGCLDRWCRSMGKQADNRAHCPTDCADRVAISRQRERDHLATSRPGAMHTGGA